MDTFTYLGSLITEDSECRTYDGIPCQVKQRQAIGASPQKIWKSHSMPISTKIRLIKTLVWPVVTYGCESWTQRKNEETRLDVFEMKIRRKILRVSWTAKKTNEWVLNKAGVKKEQLDTVKARKLALLWSHHEEIRELPGERDNARNHARCTQAWKATHGLDGQHQDVDRTPWKSQSE